MSASLLVACAGTTLLALGPDTGSDETQAQSQSPIFRTDVNAVMVDVTVTDKRGAVVRDLRRDEFQVFENGKEEAITTFGVIDLPIEVSNSGFRGVTIDSDVASTAAVSS